MKIHIVRQLNEDVWKRFVEEQPAGNIFHTPEMFRVQSQVKGYKPKLWAAIDNSGGVQSLMLPVEISLYNGPLRRVTTRAVIFGSVLVADGPDGQVGLEKMLRAYAEETGGAFLFTESRNVSDLTPLQPVLERSGFIYEDHLNYLVDLRRSEEEVFSKISKRTRSYIRRALRQEELTIREIKDPADLLTCYELLRLTYQNAQVPLADISLFESAFDHLAPQNMIRFTAVYWQEIPIAVTVDLYYKDVVYYWYGGMDRDQSSRHPNELLRWHIIQQAIEQGYGLFDFGGAGRPDQVYGVRNFKAKFGGDLVNYGRNVFTHSPRLLRLSTLGYGAMRRLF